MLRLDHDIVSCPHDLSFGQADRVPLDDFFDVGLWQLGVRGERPPERVGVARQSARSGSQGKHGVLASVLRDGPRGGLGKRRKRVDSEAALR